MRTQTGRPDEAVRRGAAARGVVTERVSVLDRLSEAVDRARRAERAMVIISGPAGFGKTTVIDAFTEQLTGPSVRVARGSCVEHYGSAEPYLPLLDALTSLARSDPDVIRVLAQHAPLWLAQMPSFFDTAVHANLHSRIQHAAPERMLREMAEALDVLALDQVVVLVLEDLHWADPSTCSLLLAVARRRHATKLVVLATVRTDEAPLHVTDLLRELRTHRVASEITLAPLGAPGVRECLERRLGTTAIDDSLVHHLHARTEGHPLFLARTLELLLREGTLRSNEGRWQASETLRSADERIPETLRGFALKRAERLPPELKAVAEAASVIGNEFTGEAVAAALGIDIDEAERRCTELGRRSAMIASVGALVREDGCVTTTFRFTHAFVRDTLYGSIEEGRRRRLQTRLTAREVAEATARATPARGVQRFVREGEYWTAEFDGSVCRVRDVRGMAMLATLLACPGREVHALDLACDAQESSPAVDAAVSRALATMSGLSEIDMKARRAYGARVRAIAEELERSQRSALEGALELDAELQLLSRELQACVGLGGRARATGSPAERARVNVTRAIKAAIRKIGEHHASLGHHLSDSVRTGTFCAYVPTVGSEFEWHVDGSLRVA